MVVGGMTSGVDEVKYNTETYYTDTYKNAFSDLEGQQKGYYNIVECDSDKMTQMENE